MKMNLFPRTCVGWSKVWCVVVVVMVVPGGLVSAMPQLGEEGSNIRDTTAPQEHPAVREPVNVQEYTFVNDRTSPQRPQKTSGNNCLWAIVTCCDTDTQAAQHHCFDFMGCGGAWFSNNFCSPEFISIVETELSNEFSRFADVGLSKK